MSTTEHTSEELNALYIETGRACARFRENPYDQWKRTTQESNDGVTWTEYDGFKPWKFLRLAPTPKDRAKAELIANNESVRQEWEAGGRKRVVEWRNPTWPRAEWFGINDPAWSDEYEYRLRPEPVYAPWDDWDLLTGRTVRRKNDRTRLLLSNQTPEGVHVFDWGGVRYEKLLSDFVECILENGQIVERPCGKREEAK